MQHFSENCCILEMRHAGSSKVQGTVKVRKFKNVWNLNSTQILICNPARDAFFFSYEDCRFPDSGPTIARESIINLKTRLPGENRSDGDLTYRRSFQNRGRCGPRSALATSLSCASARRYPHAGPLAPGVLSAFLSFQLICWREYQTSGAISRRFTIRLHFLSGIKSLCGCI